VSRGMQRVRHVLAALALAVVFSARAGYAAEPAALAFAPGGNPSAAAASVSVVEALQGLERDLAAHAGPGAAASDVDVLPEVERFYDRLTKEPQPSMSKGRAAGPEALDELPEDDTLPGAILDLALKYSGVPYRWAGASYRGLDCSGLVVKAAADGGARLPHSAALLHELGEPVVEGGLRRGDLVFFKNTYKPGISHVGIYLGGMRFLHASSSAGKVTTGDLRRPYFRQRYAGARRLHLAREVPRSLPRITLASGRRLVAPYRLGAS